LLPPPSSSVATFFGFFFRASKTSFFFLVARPLKKNTFFAAALMNYFLSGACTGLQWFPCFYNEKEEGWQGFLSPNWNNKLNTTFNLYLIYQNERHLELNFRFNNFSRKSRVPPAQPQNVCIPPPYVRLCIPPPVHASALMIIRFRFGTITIFLYDLIRIDFKGLCLPINALLHLLFVALKHALISYNLV